MRRTRLAPMSARRRANTRLWKATKQAVLARDSWTCVLCLATAVDVHHRKQKSLGGTDHPENLVSVCRPHHDDIHHNITLYEGAGLLLHGWEPEAGSLMWHHRGRRWCSPSRDGFEWMNPGDGPIPLLEHLLRLNVSAAIRDAGQSTPEMVGIFALASVAGAGTGLFAAWLFAQVGVVYALTFLGAGAVLSLYVIHAGRKKP